MENSQLLFQDLSPHVKKNAPSGFEPLAYKLSPQSFEEYIGQDHILKPGKALRQLIETDTLTSLILWGPPGCGKTGLSRLISKKTKANYLALNAVTAKIGDIKNCVEKAKKNQLNGQKTLLFIDEIHRFNKVQQDALLPEVENGRLILIGATTENPFFSVIPALISRTQIFELFPLTHDELAHLVTNILKTPHLTISLTEETKQTIILHAKGDARKLINLLETLEKIYPNQIIEPNQLENMILSTGISHNDDAHYDLISAYIKSMRGSDPDAALYWLARLLKGGEDPLFIIRRMIIFASEDIGNADPQALPLTTSLIQAAQFIGMPEIRINLAQVTTYLASAPKSNASYEAIEKTLKHIDNGHVYAVPNHLKDATYTGAKKMGYGAHYDYPHLYTNAVSAQTYLPELCSFYAPKESGEETVIKKRLAWLNQQKEKKRNPDAQ
jgi:putative ATPase